MFSCFAPHPNTSSNNKKLFLILALLLVAFLTRFWVLGNPFIFFDEEYYLFVGGRMLHGDVPYVDIWDRKPFGLFLLYEFFHLFGPYRIWAYQTGALLSAWGTSCLCMRIARLIAPPAGSFLAGCLYLLWVAGAQGSGGQAPIFYNLLVAWAMLCITRLLNAETKNRFFRASAGIMLLFGLALQIKTTVVFEGIYAGLVLVWLAKKQRFSLSMIAFYAATWCCIALLPTVLVVFFYSINGHFHEWWFANVSSIFLKTPSPIRSIPELWFRIHWGVVMFFIVSSITLLRLVFDRRLCCSRSVVLFLGGWAWAAFAGFAIFGSFSKHYALPLFVPFFINAAPLWQSRITRIWICFLLLWGGMRTYTTEKKIHHSGNMAVLQQITTRLSSPQGCIFNFSGPDIILDALPYCSLTPYPFSAHLSSISEKNALGVNPMLELKRIMANNPLYVITSDDRENNSGTNMETQTYLSQEIIKSYHEIYRHSYDKSFDNIIIYQRK